MHCLPTHNLLPSTPFQEMRVEGSSLCGQPGCGGGAPRRRHPSSAWVDCWGCRQQHAQDLQELAREAEERLIEAQRRAAEDAQVRHGLPVSHEISLQVSTGRCQACRQLSKRRPAFIAPHCWASMQIAQTCVLTALQHWI